MKRRLFLQLLGLGGAAAALSPAKTPLIATAEMPPIEGFPHMVITGGSYTGRLFDGSMWTRGTNAGFPSFGKDISLPHPWSGEHADAWKESQPKATTAYSMEDIKARSRFFPPGVDRIKAMALTRYREEVDTDLQALWKEMGCLSPEHTFVTVLKSPLKIIHRRGAHNLCKIHCMRQHFILKGELKPSIVWSDNGRIPLMDDFPEPHDLHEWLAAQARKKVTLVAEQKVPRS